MASTRRHQPTRKEAPADQKSAKTLSAGHNAKNYTNLSNWLLQEVGLDKKEILYSKTSGKKKSLGFRALAHLSVIIYPHITTDQSPILSGQWTERTRDYGVFRLMLTGVDDSSVTPETAIATIDKRLVVERPPLSPDVMGQMISDYEDELAKMTENPDGLDDEETTIDDQLDKLAFPSAPWKVASPKQPRNARASMTSSPASPRDATKSPNYSNALSFWMLSTRTT
jgi:hypothetical protein